MPLDLIATTTWKEPTYGGSWVILDPDLDFIFGHNLRTGESTSAVELIREHKFNLFASTDWKPPLYAPAPFNIYSPEDALAYQTAFSGEHSTANLTADRGNVVSWFGADSYVSPSYVVASWSDELTLYANPGIDQVVQFGNTIVGREELLFPAGLDVGSEFGDSTQVTTDDQYIFPMEVLDVKWELTDVRYPSDYASWAGMDEGFVGILRNRSGEFTDLHLSAAHDVDATWVGAPSYGLPQHQQSPATWYPLDRSLGMFSNTGESAQFWFENSFAPMLAQTGESIESAPCNKIDFNTIQTGPAGQSNLASSLTPTAFNLRHLAGSVYGSNVFTESYDMRGQEELSVFFRQTLSGSFSGNWCNVDASFGFVFANDITGMEVIAPSSNLFLSGNMIPYTTVRVKFKHNGCATTARVYYRRAGDAVETAIDVDLVSNFIDGGASLQRYSVRRSTAGNLVFDIYHSENYGEVLRGSVDTGISFPDLPVIPLWNYGTGSADVSYTNTLTITEVSTSCSNGDILTTRPGYEFEVDFATGETTNASVSLIASFEVDFFDGEMILGRCVTVDCCDAFDISTIHPHPTALDNDITDVTGTGWTTGNIFNIGSIAITDPVSTVGVNSYRVSFRTQRSSPNTTAQLYEILRAGFKFDLDPSSSTVGINNGYTPLIGSANGKHAYASMPMPPSYSKSTRSRNATSGSETSHGTFVGAVEGVLITMEILRSSTNTVIFNLWFGDVLKAANTTTIPWPTTAFFSADIGSGYWVNDGSTYDFYDVTSGCDNGNFLTTYPSDNISGVEVWTGETLDVGLETSISLPLNAFQTGETNFAELEILPAADMLLDGYTGENVFVSLATSATLTPIAYTGETGFAELDTNPLALLVPNAYSGENVFVSLATTATIPLVFYTGENVFIDVEDGAADEFIPTARVGEQASIVLNVVSAIQTIAQAGETFLFDITPSPAPEMLVQVYVGEVGSTVLSIAQQLPLNSNYTGERTELTLGTLDNWYFRTGEMVNVELSTTTAMPMVAYTGELGMVDIYERPSEPLGILYARTGESLYVNLKSLDAIYLYPNLISSAQECFAGFDTSTSFDLLYTACLPVINGELDRIELSEYPAPDVKYDGDKLYVVVDLCTLPRFSMQAYEGHNFRSIDPIYLGVIKASHGEVAVVEHVDFEFTDFRLCSGNFIPDGDNIAIELVNVYDENCASDVAYTGESMFAVLQEHNQFQLVMSASETMFFDLVIDTPWLLRSYVGELAYVNNPEFPVLPKTGEGMFLSFYEAPWEFFVGETMTLGNLTTEYNVEFLEQGCLPNEYVPTNENGDADFEKFNPVPVELEFYRHSILARCF